MWRATWSRPVHEGHPDRRRARRSLRGHRCRHPHRRCLRVHLAAGPAARQGRRLRGQPARRADHLRGRARLGHGPRADQVRRRARDVRLDRPGARGSRARHLAGLGVRAARQADRARCRRRRSRTSARSRSGSAAIHQQPTCGGDMRLRQLRSGVDDDSPARDAATPWRPSEPPVDRDHRRAGRRRLPDRHVPRERGGRRDAVAPRQRLHRQPDDVDLHGAVRPGEHGVRRGEARARRRRQARSSRCGCATARRSR